MKTTVIAIQFLLILCMGILYLNGVAGKNIEGKTSIPSPASSLLTDRVLLQSRLSNLSLKTDLIVEDTSGVKCPLKRILDSSRQIVLRISDEYCMECIKAQLVYLKMLAGRIGSDHVLLLGSFNTFKAFKIFMHANELSFKAYNIDQKDLSYLQTESMYAPYFFEIDSKGSADYVFFPAKELPELSQAYCEQVAKAY